MSIKTSFSGKRILITGGANGLGRGIVKKFHDDNAIVFTVDRDEAALKGLKAEFPRVTYTVVDLLDWDATRKAVEDFGPMDHLVNNAGLVIPMPFLEITKDSFYKQIGVNYGAMVNISQVIAKGMIATKNPGSIVNISSIADRMVFPNLGAYSGSKAAVTLNTKLMAVELAPHNIRVNCICPGAMNTPMFASGSEEIRANAIKKTLVKRVIEVSEVADLVCYLLSPVATMMTGEDVILDGGYTIASLAEENKE